MVYYFIISEIFLRYPKSIENFCKTQKMEEYYRRRYTNFVCAFVSYGNNEKRKFCKILVSLQYYEVELL